MPTNAPLPDYTPEEKARILAEMKKQSTVEDLIGYIENDDETFPAADVLAEAEAVIHAKRGLPTEGAK